MGDTIHTARYEENFIERTYGSIVSEIPVAFSELVANAWDAGATKVKITIPNEKNGLIIIEDNGAGMTEEEFQERWMTFGYNRVAHQGNYIDYTSSNASARRLAYGRNGVGRHALFCFANEYKVETWKDGKGHVFTIRMDDGDSPFSLISSETIKGDGKGTKLSVIACKKLPQKNNVIRTLGYCYLFDPEFEVAVNGEKVRFQEHLDPIAKETIALESIQASIKVMIYEIPEGEKTTARNGIAFWSGGRLVGNPSWSIGYVRVEDARRKFAQRHLVVVKTDDLMSYVQYDWSRFLDNTPVEETYQKVTQYVRNYRVAFYKGKICEVRNDVIRRRVDEIRVLPEHALSDLKLFFDEFLAQKPETDSDELDVIVTALLSVFQSRNGLSLLEELSMMNSEEIDTLDEILDNWTVSDIRDVLLEIDQRIKVVCAIEQLLSDPKTNELHVLHPLICESKWLFGIEYDNPHFTSNKGLTTVLEGLLHAQRNQELNINWHKRPDLVIGSDFSLSSTCTEDVDDNDIAYIDRVLIIELKRGGFCINRNEVSQAEEYVDSIYKGNALNSKPHKIKAFVVGDQVSADISNHKKLENYGEVFAYTYQQLVQTASKRLFHLKERLSERYQEMSTGDYLAEILAEPEQIKL